MNTKQWLIVGGTALVSGAAGVIGGFLYAKKTLVEGFTEILNAEIDEVREHYRARSPMKSYASPQEAAEALLSPQVFESVFKDLGEVVETEEEEEVNVFDNQEDPQNGEPYVISVDEFTINDSGNRQVSVTYYLGDNVLADEQDEPITPIEKFIGQGSPPFGRLSRDRNIVYIRNNRINTDFEIAKSEGLYSEEVLGFQPEQTARQRINGTK